MKGLTRENLGTRIKVLREEVCMEQETVARVLQIPRSAVSAIEYGKRDITSLELVEFCKLFRITPNDLLGWHKYKSRKYLDEQSEEK